MYVRYVRLYGAFKLRNYYILFDSVGVQNSFIFDLNYFKLNILI